MEDFLTFSGKPDMLLRLGLNLIVITIIIRYLYFRRSKRSDYLFTFFIISIVVFLLCYLLESVKIELGFALGLFAIFGILRYRTKTIPIKEMTYLFLVIGISIINALATEKINFAELVITNVFIILITALVENLKLFRSVKHKTITYSNIEFVKPKNKQQLIDDLIVKTGLDIFDVHIGNIDFSKENVKLRIFYYLKSEETFDHEDIE